LTERSVGVRTFGQDEEVPSRRGLWRGTDATRGDVVGCRAVPWSFDPETRGDDVVRAVHHPVATGGVAAVTYRAVGGLIGIAHSSLHDNFPDRAHLLKVAAWRLAQCREEYFAARVPRDGLSAMIPPTGEEEMREPSLAWLAFRDHARIEPMLSHVMAEARQHELDLIRIELGRPPGDPVCEVVQALLEGLESACTVGEEPMSRDHAVGLLELALSALVARPDRGPGDGWCVSGALAVELPVDPRLGLAQQLRQQRHPATPDHDGRDDDRQDDQQGEHVSSVSTPWLRRDRSIDGCGAIPPMVEVRLRWLRCAFDG
jgi:AcrR family transcriptional regulator